MNVINKVGKLFVQYSAFIILHDKNEEALIDYIADNGFEVKLGIKFTHRQDTTDQKLESYNVDGRTYIILQNFNNPLGTGIVEPIQVAVIGGRKLYILFWTYDLGNTSKKIEYEFLMEE